MPDHRFRVSRVQVPGLLVDFRLVDGHAHVQAKMLSPRGHIVFQTEQAELIQIFFERAMERAVAPKCSLHFLHQNSKLLSILPGDEVIGRYGDRTVVVIRHDGQIERVIERGFFDLGFSGEVDRESMPEGQDDERDNSRSRQK